MTMIYRLYKILQRYFDLPSEMFSNTVMFTPFYALCVQLGSLPASGKTFVNAKISLRQYGEFHNAM